MKKNKHKIKHGILAIIFIISIIFSGILAFFPIGKICDAASGCAVVYKSEYSYFLGINNARLGFVAFLALLGITVSHLVWPKKEKELLIIAGTALASLLALFFIYLQVFSIKAFCKYCMIVDIASLIALGVLIFYWGD